MEDIKKKKGWKRKKKTIFKYFSIAFPIYFKQLCMFTSVSESWLRRISCYLTLWVLRGSCQCFTNPFFVVQGH